MTVNAPSPTASENIRIFSYISTNFSLGFFVCSDAFIIININTRHETIAAILTSLGFLNTDGGVLPSSTSLVMPPPTAVTIPSTHTPSRSILFFIAVIAPDIANAITPIISKTSIKSFILNLNFQYGVLFSVS